MEALMAIDEACYNKLDLYFFLFEEQDVKLAFRTKELCTNHTLKCFCKLVFKSRHVHCEYALEWLSSFVWD